MANNHPFPPELQDLAQKLSNREEEHNHLVRVAESDRNSAYQAGRVIAAEIAFRERVAAKVAFDKALDAYLESCRGR